MIDSYDAALKIVLDTMDTAQRLQPDLSRDEAFVMTYGAMREQAVNARGMARTHEQAEDHRFLLGVCTDILGGYSNPRLGPVRVVAGLDDGGPDAPAFLTSGDIDTHDEHWRCSCGNTPDTDGFAFCLADGAEVEPSIESGWDGLYRCQSCGAVFNRNEKRTIRPSLTKVAV